MLSRDFIFWLQGYFELLDEPNISLDEKKVQIITNHLNLVYKFEKKPEFPFVIWLKGFLDLSGQKTFSVEQTDLLRMNLGAVFLHEIDPKMGDFQMQEDLNSIHSNGIYHNNDSDHTNVRC